MLFVPYWGDNCLQDPFDGFSAHVPIIIEIWSAVPPHDPHPKQSSEWAQCEGFLTDELL